MLALLRNLVIAFALIMGAVFSFYNLHEVNVDLLWLQVRTPLVILLVATFVLGFALAMLVLAWRLTRVRGRLAQSRRELKDAQAEIKNLRSTPIHDA